MEDHNLASSPPSLLQPPATVVSPPSPTKAQSLPPYLSPRPQSPAHKEEPASIDSPDDIQLQESPPSLLSTADIDGTPPSIMSPRPSQSHSPVYLQPASPALPTPSVFTILRSPSPSSPAFRPKQNHHRRASSTHRVRETIDGTQTSTEAGDRMINQYKIGQCLGQGAYAKVELGVDVETGIEYAIKEFSKSRLHHHSLQEKHRATTRDRLRRGRMPYPVGRISGESSRKDEERPGLLVGPEDDGKPEDPLGLIRREIAVMKKIDHPNLVHLYEAISVPTADALLLVLEYLPGGTLMTVHIGQNESEAQAPFDREQTREYFRQLCLGLEYLHANEVVHRDIKPDNILLSADRQMVKLCDFGVSEMFTKAGDDRVRKSGGSPAFQSPESFQSLRELHGKAIDIWALGITLYCMLTGNLPFNYPNAIELYAAVMENDPRIPEDWELSLKDLVTRMLYKDPEKRIALSDIREHAWTTADGRLLMIDTEENLFEVGKHVEEPTQDEIKDAIETFRGIFHVVRAVNKMRNLHRHRQSSTQGVPSPSCSTNASLASGSVDSYVSQDPLTSNTSVSSADESDSRLISGETVSSPRQMSLASTPVISTQSSLQNKFQDLCAVDTKLQPMSRKESELVDSPTSENDDETMTERVGSESSRDLSM